MQVPGRSSSEVNQVGSILREKPVGGFVCVCGYALFALLYYISPCSVAAQWGRATSRVSLAAGALISTVIALMLGNQLPEEGGQLTTETCSVLNRGLPLLLLRRPFCRGNNSARFYCEDTIWRVCFFFGWAAEIAVLTYCEGLVLPYFPLSDLSIQKADSGCSQSKIFPSVYFVSTHLSHHFRRNVAFHGTRQKYAVPRPNSDSFQK